MFIYLFLDVSPKDTFTKTIKANAQSEYDIRLYWAAVLEIIALFLSSFTLFIQILYLISTYRNRIG